MPKFDTLQVHAGVTAAEHNARPHAVPIHITAQGREGGPVYKLLVESGLGSLAARALNPTTEVFENRMAALEDGCMSVATSSGQAANFVALLTICSSGNNIVSLSSVCSSTYDQFRVTLPRLGISVKLARDADPKTIAALLDDNTRAIYLDTFGTPSFTIPDIRKIADVAHQAGVPLIVDNTFGCGGYLCSPIKLGADIVVHSATRWICGHGTTIGGVIIDAGTFSWNNGKFPMFTDPSPDFQGIKFWDAFESKPPAKTNMCFAIRARLEALRDVGATPNPFSSFLLLQGLETLSLRVDRHCENALVLARWLTSHPSVNWVRYPGLSTHESHQLAKEILRDGRFGCLLSFGLKGGIEACRKFVNSVRLANHSAALGDSKTMVIHPASSTYQNVLSQEKDALGVSDDMIRVSVGIEHIDDIKEDFEQALPDDAPGDENANKDNVEPAADPAPGDAPPDGSQDK